MPVPRYPHISKHVSTYTYFTYYKSANQNLITLTFKLKHQWQRNINWSSTFKVAGCTGTLNTDLKLL